MSTDDAPVQPADWDDLADYYAAHGYPHTREPETADWPTYDEPVRDERRKGAAA